MSKNAASAYDCIDEVPLHRVRGNQLGILLSVVASVLTQQAWVLAIPLAVQLIGRWAGIRYNPFVRLLSPLFPKSTRTESRELLRFNNLLAILFLATALIAWLLQAKAVAYASLAMLTGAVVAALCGFCVGCFMYFQWKRFRAKRVR
ncbi:DUF4395 domain-containing protein [Paenibacillus antri]|uniref:DUF4395 domain-containing protein n=1 Tax=Paenibacillus antri TaxID=2582848 RepID=A0A5R9GKF6_9BACL|nr:DUF4395 domain-containing protein [Paenibacillus antri]TLS54064.1 DUF4395 domain-containing protein [Paenibacillus antri]